MSRPVYQSGVGRMCPECSRAIDACRCRGKRSGGSKGDRRGGGGAGAPAGGGSGKPAGGKVHVALEKKGRRGKAVTVIHARPLSAFELADAAKELKSRAGTGGTVKDGAIELQGDKVDLARAWLTEKGYA